MQYIDCFINPISRQVSYPGAVIVQRDTHVEALRFHFSLQAEHALEDDSIRVMVKTGKEIRGFNAENVRIETNDGGDEELVFEHTITRYETEVPGQINVSVCGNQISGDTITEAWHTLNMSFQVGSSVHTDSDEGEDSEETAASNAEKIAALQTLVDAITSGRPIPVNLKSKMVDTSAIYLYTGNEQGEQHNYWYYHDGTTWVAGSEYGGMTIDDELSSTSENAVQNKVIKANFDEVNGRLTQQQKGEVYILGNIQADHYIRENTGKLTGYTGWSATDFLSCDGLDFLYVLATSISRNYNAFYSDLDETTYISSFAVSVGKNKIAVPENAKYYRLSNTANALLEEKVYTATQGELDTVKKDIAELRVAAGNSTSGVFSSNSRAIYVPFTFELGKTYKINFADSAQTVTHLKVLSDGNLNAGSVIHQWTVNGNSYETEWKCDTAGGLYLLLLSASDVESNSASVYIHDISEMEGLLSESRVEAEVVPGVDGITFSGNTRQSDPLVVTIPQYFWRNENASYTNAYSSATGGEYSLGHNNGLYYNVLTHELGVFSTSTPIDTAYILLLWKQTTVIKGAWAFYYYDSVLRGDISQLSANVSVISEKISDIIPAYYNADDYLANKIKAVNANQPLNGISFAFITDLHFKSNALVSLPLLEHLIKTTPVDMIISGGDYTNAYGDDADIWYAYNTLMKYAKNLYPNWFSARGNHDFTVRTSSSVSTGVTWGDAITKSGIIKSAADWRYEVITPDIPFINADNNVYTNYCWTITNEKEKVKILYLCDFDATDTSTWFGVIGTRSNVYCAYLGKMLKETDGYTVIVLTHAPLTNELVGGINSKITNVVTAFANRQSITLGTYSVDFTQSTGVLAACISGHSHCDQYAVVNGVLHINTTCDACYADDGYGGTIGTITEQAFDVFAIDTSARTIKAVRIGRGNNREWSY